MKMSFLLHGATILRSFIIVFINIPHLFVIIRYNFFPTQNKHMYYMHACINAVFNYHHIAYAVCTDKHSENYLGSYDRPTER